MDSWMISLMLSRDGGRDVGGDERRFQLSVCGKLVLGFSFGWMYIPTIIAL